MLRRPMSYVLLGGFAVVMVVLLMRDDPANQQAQRIEFRATAQARQPLFPELSDPAQIFRIEVLDVTEDRVILFIRDEQGVWYAPKAPDADPAVGDRADALAYVLAMIGNGQWSWYDATPENMEQFGFWPTPQVVFRFRGRDDAGQAYESVIFEVGDVNPDNVAYYVWPQGDERIYLIPKELVAPMLAKPNDGASMPDELSVDSEATVPVP